MPQESCERDAGSLDAEKIAYWYLRLNGFLQIENFVVHPSARGGQRTDADLLAVRFPHRAERLFDNPNDIMQDDGRLQLSPNKIDVLIAEIKTGRCALNGPWTDDSRQNIHRVLAAVGCLPHEKIERAAANIYETGFHNDQSRIRIRLVAIGRDHDHNLSQTRRLVTQLTWEEILPFMWTRLDSYRRQKADVGQWDWSGRAIKQIAEASSDSREFADEILRLLERNTP